jgi:serine/threonine protein kinase
MSQFHHPNVTELIGYSESPFCIIMGSYSSSLDEIISTANITYKQALKYLQDIASGLAGKYAHNFA